MTEKERGRKEKSTRTLRYVTYKSIRLFPFDRAGDLALMSMST